MYRTIVVPLDLSTEAERAVPFGAAVARQAGAMLELLTVQPSHEASATVRRRLAEIATRHGVEARLRIPAAHDVARALVEVGNDPETLLCLQTHARRAISELVLGSVSESVVRTCRRPVLLIGPHCRHVPDHFATMVVGLDGSDLAEAILPTVGEWSAQFGLVPWLFQVLEGRVPLEVGADDVQETGYVHGLADGLRREGVKAEWETAHDPNPGPAIARFAADLARQRAGEPGDSGAGALIALTTQGRSGLGRLALGSVALQVTHHATVPVLVLRPGA